MVSYVRLFNRIWLHASTRSLPFLFFALVLVVSPENLFSKTGNASVLPLIGN